MPELPEVESLRRMLHPQLVGRRIDGFEVYDDRLRYPVQPSRLKRWAEGRRVEDIQRRSKYLLIHLEENARLVVHLGMSGSLVLVPPGGPLGRHHVAREQHFKGVLAGDSPR